jgi:MFS superfamily sulfate permease-like transporter
MMIKGFEFSVREFAGSLGDFGTLRARMEGILEISLGLFFSQSLVNIFTSFPLFVVGVMLLMTSFELGKISLKVQGKTEIYVTVVTALLATVFKMAVGFIGGLILYFAIEKKIIKIS